MFLYVGALRFLDARVLRLLIYVGVLPLLVIVHWAQKNRLKRKLIWGPVPIINNKYWSAAMKQAGWDSITLMETYYKTYRRSDFDLYYEDLVSGIKPQSLARMLAPLLAHLYIARHAGVMHIPLSGGPLGNTPIWKLEAFLYGLAGVRTVALPFGGDAYLYSRISDLTVRHALLLSYPEAGRRENRVEKRVRYWIRHADIVVVGFTPDGIGRWDVTPGNKLCIDIDAWMAKAEYSQSDGKSGKVRVLHAPNHRGVKGTEFLLQAVDVLREEGLSIELLVVEGKQNEEVRALMQQVDILADQFLLQGYGLAAIEGMASGLPVMSNLQSEAYTRLFRRHSFLDECPILAVSPETLIRDLRSLVQKPALRRALGQAGRAYVEKYHSFAASQHLFGAIYAKLLDGKEVDLMNLFHPLKSAYNQATPKIAHPLIENRLPSDPSVKW